MLFKLIGTDILSSSITFIPFTPYSLSRVYINRNKQAIRTIENDDILLISCRYEGLYEQCG